ncbi:restriction endonuclease subunit S [Aliarcobacter butzleri]|uniref:restriction endonuclease subunit S n=1 Tax=Aliarcobacter butzleri TaxID=28197 RepID=UPI0021B3F655|nr:restriction endonuclease subunit S [Aliarcobacter butzleri]MCT7550930.1 restriction endonuclease subunit S [Aliarcobacter butzleri]MCT7559256.1 restriction endonuclease subunit S [Aliarcobacter butzleri]
MNNKVKLQDYIQIQNGYAFKSNLFQNFGIPVVRITNVENGKLNLDKVVYYSEDKKLDKFIIKKDDILLSLTGDDKTLKVCINDNDKKIYLNQRVAILRSKESLIQKYLYYSIKKYSSLILEKAKGIAQKNISVDDINSVEIPLPSIEKQNQIAKTLDKANELIELRRESITKLDALAKSIFIDMFGDPVSNPKGWEIKKILDLGKVQTGNTPPRIESDNYGDFIEWIKSDNILKDKMIITEAREYLSEKGYRKGRIADKGSLLFTCIAGSMSSIGNLAMTDRQVTFNQQINSLTPFNNNELYLYSLFKLCKKFFEENSTKSMKIMINKSTFENLLFPIAPIDLQNKFAEIIEKIEEQKSLYEKELELLQNNFDALLQKSFQE